MKNITPKLAVILSSLIISLSAAAQEAKSKGYLSDEVIAGVSKDLQPGADDADVLAIQQVRAKWAKSEPTTYCEHAKKYEAPLNLEIFYGDIVDAKRINAACPLITKVINDVAGAIEPLKVSFSRTRPYVKHQQELDAQLAAQGFTGCAHTATEAPQKSFPSMHSAMSEAHALILEQILGKDFQDRATEIRESRNVLAVHYPSDVKVGMEVAKRIWNAEMNLPKDSAFWRDLDACKDALKN